MSKAILDGMVKMASTALEMGEPPKASREQPQLHIRLSEEQLQFIDGFVELTGSSRTRVSLQLIEIGIEQLSSRLDPEVLAKIRAYKNPS